MSGPGWAIESADGLSVMSFGLLADRGIRHGMVVKKGGREIDDRVIYGRFSAAGPTVVTEQTHSTSAAVVGRGFGDFHPRLAEVDGLMTGMAGVRLTIHTADCVPVFLAASDGRAVGLFHCGWRGTADGFLLKAVTAFGSEFRVKPEELLAVIGPSVEAACYPVGPEVAEKFGPGVKSAAAEGKWLLDLRKDNGRQLLDAGLRPDNIQVSPLCTRCRSDLFHSYRREGANLGGKMVSFIEAGHEEERG